MADANAVNRLAQELFTDPANAGALHTDRDSLFDRYGLSPAQREGLAAGSCESLTAAGMHPILQMHWAIASNPGMAEMISVRSFLPKEA